MNLLTLLILAVGLSMDAMAVALCAGASGHTLSLRPALRISFAFGFFQGAMPALGWLAGTTVAGLVGAFDHWLAFGLLVFVGARMIRSGLGLHADASVCDPTRGRELLILSLATSIDALAVGFSLALLGTPILAPCLLIGAVTFTLSFLATRLGSRLNLAFGKRMEIAGGVVLILIGLRILAGHLLG